MLLVVAFHLWPGRAPGGYVGVDIFFVISGFLITSHLMREFTASGRISLPNFWARRARRLLPAALTVLAAVTVATFVFVPQGFWIRYFSEIGASGLYIENWLLAANSVDYLAAQNSPSPVQHYWSLSVEEQFYLVWPLLIMLALLLARLRGIKIQRRWVFFMLTAITVASFLFSVIYTHLYAAPAYFVTPTRAWEFGAGALLAFVPSAIGSQRARFLAGWAGLTLIAFATIRFNATTPFPGYAALVPVLGAAAVIWSGGSQQSWSVTQLSTWRPIQFLGDISYSVYLWHWPLIVILPLVLLHPLGTKSKLAILATTVVLAVLTKLAIEDPVRRARLLVSRRPRITFAGVAAGMVVVVAACFLGTALGQPPKPLAPEPPAQASCFGAGATVASRHCSPTTSLPDWVQSASYASTDTNDRGEGHGWGNCEAPAGQTIVRTCILGNFKNPKNTVALVGDSHAGHWEGALDTVAKKLHWNVITYARSACTGTGDDAVYFDVREFDRQDCAAWGRKVTSRIVSNPAISAVFVSSVSDRYLTEPSQQAVSPSTYQSVWSKYVAAGKQVYVLGDTPVPISNVPECLQTKKSISDCSVRENTAVVPNVMKEAALTADSSQIRFFDFTDRFCIAGTCPPVIGNVIVYADDSHMTKTYSKTVGVFLLEKLRSAS